MSNTPLVSVVIPCYNHGCYLDDAIASVRAQSHRPVEIIVVDDGSTDDTRRHATAHLDVRYTYQENAGLAAARNTGLSISTGEFVVFLDADDQLLPDCLSTNLKFLLSDPKLAFAAGSFRWINHDGTLITPRPYHGIKGDYYRHFIEWNFIGMHAAVMYRRKTLLEAGGFNPRLRACEDYDVYLRISQRHPIACHSAILAHYRRHGSGLSNNAPLMLKSVFTVLQSQLPFIENSNDLRLRDAYRRGVNRWRNLYGLELLVSTMRAVRNGDWSKVARQTMVLLPLVPLALADQVSRRLRRLPPTFPGSFEESQKR